MLDKLEGVAAERGIYLKLHQSMRHQKLAHEGDNFFFIAQQH
jgi:hypothetical protein